MAGVFSNGFASQRGNLVSGTSDLPPLLKQFVTPQASPQMLQDQFNPWSQPGAVAPPEQMGQSTSGRGNGNGLNMAVNNAIKTFNFRRNYAEGGLVGPQQVTGQPSPQMPGQQLQATAQQVMQSNPQVVQQLQQAIMQAVQSGAITPQQLNMAVQMARAASQNPELYPRLREMAIQNGLAQEDELPPQYDQGIVFAMLLAGEAAQQAMQGGAAPSAGAPAFGPPGKPGGNYAEGGAISTGRSPDKSGKADDISINVSGGEFVIPKHVVAAKGTEFFDRMLEQYDPKNPDSKVNKA